jgi:hypothetical protein
VPVAVQRQPIRNLAPQQRVRARAAAGEQRARQMRRDIVRAGPDVVQVGPRLGRMAAQRAAARKRAAAEQERAAES